MIGSKRLIGRLASKDEGNRPDSEWVSDLLRWCAERTEVSTPLSFVERCREAAIFVKEVGSLRESAIRIGFEALPFGQYVERVAYAAGMTLRPILASLGISKAGNTSGLDNISAALVHLAVGMGIPSRQLIIHLKLGALAKAKVPLAQFARLRRESENKAALTTLVEEEIGDVEQKMGPSFLENSRILEKQVIRFYREYS